MGTRWQVDKSIADAVSHALSKEMKLRDVRTGDLLLTLIAVIKIWIRAGNLKPEAEALVIHTLVEELTRRDDLLPGLGGGRWQQ